MAPSETQAYSINKIEQEIVKKARERNRELHKEFYSYDAGQYEIVDINTYANFKLLLFRCPKSKSTVSIKINNREVSHDLSDSF